MVLEQPGRPVVVLDEDLIRRIGVTLDALPRDAQGLVLASASERSFVAGADLTSIRAEDESGLSDESLHRYLEYGSSVFAKLLSLPYPTAAAISGAALGGGLELAMHCDGLIGAPPPERDGKPGRPYPIGLPEAGLKICPGWGGTNLLPARIDPAEAIRRTATGATWTYHEAADAGMFDSVAPSADELRATASNWVREQSISDRHDKPSRWIGERASAVADALETVRGEMLAATGGEIEEHSEAVFSAIDAGITHGWQRSLAVERDRLVRLRSRPAGRAAIGAFLDKSRK